MVALAFVLLAGAGAISRALAGEALNRPVFPWGTVLVNVTGSFALGLIMAWSPPATTLAGTAFLGAYTTFSSFSRDVASLWEHKKRRAAIGYVAFTVLGSVTAAIAGLALSGG
ncbi:MAG: CrcB family protein [Acidimicrobiales bacterium]|nr:CrcB family protein [Acidimicrobiales bacterium]